MIMLLGSFVACLRLLPVGLTVALSPDSMLVCSVPTVNLLISKMIKNCFLRQTPQYCITSHNEISDHRHLNLNLIFVK